LLPCRNRRQSRHGLLDHGLLAVKREQLLGAFFSAERPEARSPAAGKNDRIEISWHQIFSGIRYRSTAD
jgi:hypothetical protein